MAFRVRKGDLVAVISGDDRGKRGRVLRVIPERNRVIVEGVNVVFKHLRKSQEHPQGGRIRREAAVDLSNVMPIDSETNRPTRVAYRLVEGRHARVGVRSGAPVGAGKTSGRRSSATKAPEAGKAAKAAKAAPKEPAAKKPAAKKAAAKKADAKKPSAKKPAAKKPAAGKPAAEKPSSTQGEGKED
jgi:large subunit ribosomal protein L24